MKIPPKMLGFCPHCRQPITKDAVAIDLKGSGKLKCEFCDQQASFIIDRSAVCFEHRQIPLTRIRETARP